MITQLTIENHPWFATHTKGTRPQQASFEHGEHLGHRVYVCLEFNMNRLYSSFESVDAFWDYYSSFTGPRCFYWINRSYQLDVEKSPLHFDIEWMSNGIDPHAGMNIEKMQRAVRTSLPDFECEFELEDLTREISDNQTKNSFHLFITNAVLEQNASGCMKQFVQEVIWRELKDDQDMWAVNPKSGVQEPIVDMGIYTKSRAFRVPGSSKVKGYTALPLPTKEFFLKTRLCDRYNENVTFASTSKSEPQEKHTKSRKRKSTPKGSNPEQIEQPEIQQIIDRITELLRTSGDQDTEVYWNGEYCCGRNYPERGRTCLVGGELIHNNNCFFKIDEVKNVTYHCFGTSGHTFCAGKVIGNIGTSESQEHAKWTEENEYIGNGDGTNEYWQSGVTITEHDKEKWVLEYERTAFTKLLAVKANMGLGKTTAANKLAQKYRARNKRVLIVTSRISLSHTLHGAYTGFTHYSARNYNADQLIIQYESLHHLIGQQPYDLVILDETRSLCASMTSIKTNRCNLRTNAKLLRLFMQQSEFPVCMDADLEIDPAVPKMIQN